jgi:hypothetical protein
MEKPTRSALDLLGGRKRDLAPEKRELPRDRPDGGAKAGTAAGRTEPGSTEPIDRRPPTKETGEEPPDSIPG